MSGIKVTNEAGVYYVTGNTYAMRTELKARGLRWDAGRKAWVTSNEQAVAEFEKIEALVDRAERVRRMFEGR